LLAGILGIPPIQLAGYIQTETDKEHLPPPPSGTFQQGYALVMASPTIPRLAPCPKLCSPTPATCALC
jgi:hypothetical protein